MNNTHFPGLTNRNDVISDERSYLPLFPAGMRFARFRMLFPQPENRGKSAAEEFARGVFFGLRAPASRTHVGLPWSGDALLGEMNALLALFVA